MSATAPLRVCVVLHESAQLGAGVAIARAIPALQALGCEVSVLLPEEGPIRDALAGCEIAVARPARPIGVSLRGWRAPPGPVRRLRDTRAYFASVGRALDAAAPDVVHVNSLHALPEGAVAHRRGLPVVLHAHEIPRPGVKRGASVRAAGRLADVVVPVSRAVAALYAGAVAPARLMTVYNGVAEREPVVGDGPVRVGTIGSVCRRKGTDILVEAARIVHATRPEIAFEHLGPAGLANEREFEARLATLVREPADVSFLGAGSADAALARWAIFVLPSREEGFPLASLEAMAAGLPVVASAVGGVTEQIRDGETGLLVAPDDPGALARAIVSLADDPPRRRSLGEAARAHVNATFTYEQQARGLRAAYLAARAWRAECPSR